MEIRLINKNTGEEKFIDVPNETQIQEYFAYHYLETEEWVEIPNDGNPYKLKDTEPFYELDMEKILLATKQTLLNIIDSKRKSPFPVLITDINNIKSCYYLNLDDSSILKILILVKKAEILGQASEEFISAETLSPQYITLSLEAIQGVQASIIQKDDILRLKANQIKTAQTLESLQTIQEELNNV